MATIAFNVELVQKWLLNTEVRYLKIQDRAVHHRVRHHQYTKMRRSYPLFFLNRVYIFCFHP